MEKSLGIIAEFDVETETKLREYGKLLAEHGFVGEQTKDFPYHITLGICLTCHEAELIARMRANAKALTAFPVSFQHVGLFGLRVLFLAPKVTRELLNLHEIFDIAEDENWVAHTTLLIDGREEILRAIPFIAERSEPIQGKVVKISLYEFFPPRLIEQIQLAPGD